MIVLFVFVISCTFNGGIFGQDELPPSPCPKLFYYENERDVNRWYGVVSFRENIDIVGINLKVLLDRKAEVLVAEGLEIRTKDNKFYNMYNPFFERSAGLPIHLRFNVKYNPSKGPPAVKTLILNGNVVCNATDPAGPLTLSVDSLKKPSTGRYDPDLNSDSLDPVLSEFVNDRYGTSTTTQHSPYQSGNNQQVQIDHSSNQQHNAQNLHRQQSNGSPTSNLTPPPLIPSQENKNNPNQPSKMSWGYDPKVGYYQIVYVYDKPGNNPNSIQPIQSSVGNGQNQDRSYWDIMRQIRDASNAQAGSKNNRCDDAKVNGNFPNKIKKQPDDETLVFVIEE